MVLRSFLLASSFLAITQNLAFAHHPVLNWLNSENVPLCPEKGAKLLSENYPKAAYVLSEATTSTGRRKPYRTYYHTIYHTIEVVTGILKHSGDQVPLIFLSVGPFRKGAIYSELDDFINRHPEFEEKRSVWKAALQEMDVGRSMPWHQDYFKEFFDPATGLPVLREVKRCDHSSFATLSRTLREVTPSLIQVSEPLRFEHPAAKIEEGSPPLRGGNILSLPGGLCLIGDTMPSDYANQFCSASDQVVIPSDKLSGGHVDEIVGILKNPKVLPPCDFVVSIASVSKGLEVLKEHPKEKFFEFFSHGEHKI